MKYMLLIVGDESQYADRSEEEFAASMKSWDEYTKELVAAGAFVAGEGLQSSTTATTLRVADGERILTDGPFVETKEQVGGFYVIDCKAARTSTRRSSGPPSCRARPTAHSRRSAR
jgi:hypothetical protein